MEMTIERLLESRKELKERKPEFIRQDNPKRMKLNYKWRKPKGIHSKIRHKFKGRRKMPSPGYKSPRKVKGMHHSGLEIISVRSILDIKDIKRETQGAVISKSVGMKKRLEILKKTKELNLRLLNLNIDEQIKKIEELVNSKKKKGTKEKKADVKEEKEKKEIEFKENLSEKSKQIEKKEKDKREKERILTKKV